MRETTNEKRTQKEIDTVLAALEPEMKKWEEARNVAQTFDLEHQSLLPVIYNRGLDFYRGLTPAQEPIVQQSENLHMAADAISRDFQIKYERALGWEDSGRTACGQDWNSNTTLVGRIRIPEMRARELTSFEISITAKAG